MTGSGGYEPHDQFSIAALSLDFGSPGGGWSQRVLLGLGMIGGGRPPHPPGWGAGSDGKTLCRPNLIKASEKPQRVTIDPAKYAPADWDGRLWIGAFLHNTGAGKSLSVRIVTPPPPGGDNDKLPEPEQWKLLRRPRNSSSTARSRRSRRPRRAPRRRRMPSPRSSSAYAAAADNGADGPPLNCARKARDAYDKTLSGSMGFLKLAEDFFAWQHRASAPRRPNGSTISCPRGKIAASSAKRSAA